MLLAQVNVALMRAGLDDPAMGGFVAALDPVYRTAEESRGFVWRLHGPDGGHRPATSDGQVVNVSVWRSYEDLHAFTYRSHHGGLVKAKQRWFRPTPQPSTALWWIADGARPTAGQALARLAYLRRHGPTPQAFGLRRRFDPSGHPVGRGRP